MLAQGMAELMGVEELEDVLVYQNPNDENTPLVKVVKTYPKEEAKKWQAEHAKWKALRAKEAKVKGEKFDEKEFELPGLGRRTVQQEKMRGRIGGSGMPSMMVLLLIPLILFIIFQALSAPDGKGENIFAALILGLLIMGAAWLFTSSISKRMGSFGETGSEPKLIVDNTSKKSAPFVDATGSKAGALFGDVRHDPLQSGGLGTPAHLRVESGAVHRANKGVLYLDEVALLTPKSQQDLLSAMQEKKFSITGQSEMSSGALVRTEPVPCDFVLVAAGNYSDIAKMHPALRSRIRGYGYEVYVEDSMPDSEENQLKLIQFVAQEVKKDGKIPHFSREAVEEIIEDAKRKAGRKNKLTLKLRELGGLIRAAGDIAREEKAELVLPGHVERARKVATTLEHQLAQQFIATKKDYKVFVTEGFEVGRVNGLAVLGEGDSGLMLPIVAEVTPASSKAEGKLVATGKLGKIAKEAVQNVSAIIKKHIGKDVSQYDIHVQFLQTYEGVEGDSASISTAVAVLSAMEDIPVDQSIAMTGSLSVRGEVLPVGGITAKIEAAIEGGALSVVIPYANKDDVYLEQRSKNKIKIIPAKTIVDVLEHVLKNHPKKKKLIADMKGI
ncbi:ATP-dependent protease LonB [Candidatus Micrarchaeota archaeon]|nr:ATP-dependent protease LonB [Candidatus Micrarchaeota archaeon]